MTNLSRGLKDTLTPPSTPVQTEFQYVPPVGEVIINGVGLTTPHPIATHDFNVPPKDAKNGSEDHAAKVPSLMKNSSGYSHERYAKLVQETVRQIEELSRLKGGEYAGDVDRLSNFRRNASNLGLNLEDVWAVYAGKHWDAIQQYVKDQRTGKKRERLESISGRADDLIVYCILFKAILEDRQVRTEDRNVHLPS